MPPIVDASIATALIAPDPLSLSASVETENDKEKTATATDSTHSAKSDNDKKKSSSSGSNIENEKKPSAKKSVVTADERFYAVDSARLEQLRSEKPWTPAGASGQQHQGGQQQGSSSSTGSAPKRPLAKYFESISLSPSAVTKMMMHCQSGVEKGIAQGGNPIEGELVRSFVHLFQIKCSSELARPK